MLNLRRKKMRDEIMIVIVSGLIALGIAFAIFNAGGFSSITGLAIQNDSLEENASVDYTEQDAFDAIKDSEFVISEMKEAGFSTAFVDDLLIEANRIMEQARSAEILRDDDASYQLKKKAGEKLRLVDWKDIDYGSVIEVADEIKERQRRALVIYDSIRGGEISLEDYVERAGNVGLSPSGEVELLGEVEEAFENERYEEAEKLLEEFSSALETKSSEVSNLGLLRRGAQNFVGRYKYLILIALLFAGAGGFFSYKGITKKVLKRKIVKLNVENKALIELIKRAQIDRFKLNKISGLVYKIRIKKYRERIGEIKEQLPVLEARLDKVMKVRRT
jgi:hypothetical protein